MRSLITGLASALLATLTFATKGVDYSTLQTQSTHECWKSNGVSIAIPRAFHSNGVFDSNGKTNVHNAHAAGISEVDIYMFPCRGKNAQTQANEIVSGMGSYSYGKIWIDIETNPSSGCSWASFSHASNCDFVGELVSALKGHGKGVGIYASHTMWESIFGSATSCTGHSDLPLWYAHYDDKETFSDFQHFGGWTSPYMKQYADTHYACGAGVDSNWRP